MNIPFLKWAGGKRWLVQKDFLPIPKKYNTYIEPFLGGGAVFFRLVPPRSILSDVNPELMELYEVVRDHPSDLIIKLQNYQSLHEKSFYYNVRSDRPKDKIDRAARFLYLNRTCWNGLYRVNKKGEFNVPIGTKTQVLMNSDNFKGIAQSLSKAILLCGDFEETISIASKGDFLFVDPPYTANHNQNGFLKYNENIFSWGDQERLCESLFRAKSRGVQVVLCNADHESIHELYSSFGEYTQVARHSTLSGQSATRRGTSEALYTSWAR